MRHAKDYCAVEAPAPVDGLRRLVTPELRYVLFGAGQTRKCPLEIGYAVGDIAGRGPGSPNGKRGFYHWLSPSISAVSVSRQLGDLNERVTPQPRSLALVLLRH